MWYSIFAVQEAAVSRNKFVKMQMAVLGKYRFRVEMHAIARLMAIGPRP